MKHSPLTTNSPVVNYKKKKMEKRVRETESKKARESSQLTLIARLNNDVIYYITLLSALFLSSIISNKDVR